MNFFILLFTYSFSFASTNIEQNEAIERWLGEENAKIINYCDETLKEMKKEVTNREIRKEFKKQIAKMKAYEFRENKTALLLLKNYQNEDIEEIIQAKIIDLNRVIARIFYTTTDLKSEDQKDFEFFLDALSKHDLLKKFSHCIIIYQKNNNGLIRPGLKTESEILEYVKLFIEKQLERFKILKDKITDLKNRK